MFDIDVQVMFYVLFAPPINRFPTHSRDAKRIKIVWFRVSALIKLIYFIHRIVIRSFCYACAHIRGREETLNEFISYQTKHRARECLGEAKNIKLHKFSACTDGA